MVQVVVWSWVSWWWMSSFEKSSWQKLLMVFLLLALHMVVSLAVWTSCCKQEALILWVFGQESCSDDVCFVPSYPMESALFLVSIVCRDSFFRGCQHCSPKAWSPKAAVQRLTHDGLGSTRICCQVFGDECMCHWCSPLSQRRGHCCWIHGEGCADPYLGKGRNVNLFLPVLWDGGNIFICVFGNLRGFEV